MSMRCLHCGAEWPESETRTACPACGRGPTRRRWLAGPMGLLVLGASVALVLALVLLGLGATGWGL